MTNSMRLDESDGLNDSEDEEAALEAALPTQHLSAEREASLCRLIQSGKEPEASQAIALLTAAYHDWMKRLVSRFCWSHKLQGERSKDLDLNSDALYGAAAEGIIEAAKRFDSTKARFSTYAERWIKNHLLRAFGLEAELDPEDRGLGLTLGDTPVPCGQRTELAACIERTGNTTASIATRLGVTQRTVQRWCSGESVPEDNQLFTLNLMFAEVKYAQLWMPAEPPPFGITGSTQRDLINDGYGFEDEGAATGDLLELGANSPVEPTEGD